MAYKRKFFKDCFRASDKLSSIQVLFEQYQQKERNDVTWHVFCLLLRNNYGAPDGEEDGVYGYQLEFVPVPVTQQSKAKTTIPGQ